jgi:hypothetical protein
MQVRHSQCADADKACPVSVRTQRSLTGAAWRSPRERGVVDAAPQGARQRP